MPRRCLAIPARTVIGRPAAVDINEDRVQADDAVQRAAELEEPIDRGVAVAPEVGLVSRQPPVKFLHPAAPLAPFLRSAVPVPRSRFALGYPHAEGRKRLGVAGPKKTVRPEVETGLGKPVLTLGRTEGTHRGAVPDPLTSSEAHIQWAVAIIAGYSSQAFL